MHPVWLETSKFKGQSCFHFRKTFLRKVFVVEEQDTWRREVQQHETKKNKIQLIQLFWNLHKTLLDSCTVLRIVNLRKQLLLIGIKANENKKHLGNTQRARLQLHILECENKTKCTFSLFLPLLSRRTKVKSALPRKLIYIAIEQR